MNRIFIVGRLGVDPELKTGKTGTPWCSLSVATNRAFKRGEEWVEETDWHDIRVFGDDAQRCSDKLRRGAVVAVDGSLVYEVWVDEEGQRRRQPRIISGRIQFVTEPKQKAGPSGSQLHLNDPRPAELEPEVVEPTLDVG